MLNSLIIKLTSSCNLTCSYCYYVGHERTPKGRLKIDDFETVFKKYADYMNLAKPEDKQAIVYWHGGEPLLLGKKFFREALSMQREYFNFPFKNSITTNGTLLDDEWIEIFKEFRLSIAVSIDGTQKSHDEFRVYRNGKGSYNQVIENVRKMLSNGITFQAIVVVNPDHDPVEVFENLRTMGCKSFDFLLPMHTHENMPKQLDKKSELYFKTLFDHWYALNNPEIEIRYFNSLITKMIGGEPEQCTLRSDCNKVMTIQPDGRADLCDDLSITDNMEIITTSLNVLEDSFIDIQENIDEKIASLGVKNHPQTCLDCSVYKFCDADCPSKRYKNDEIFGKPSVYCETFKGFIPHVISVIGQENIAYSTKKVSDANLL